MHGRSIIRRAVRNKFVVTLKGSEGSFSGILTEWSRESLTFEQCDTVPVKETDHPDRIAGRVHVFVANVAYLQEIT